MPVEVSASIGARVPFGSLQVGSAVRDVTFGSVPIEARVSYVGVNRWAFGISGSYALSVPTLCASGSDCIASLGRSATATAIAAYELRRFWKVRPNVSAGIGYEWFTAKLSDAGAAASRTYHGIVVPSLDLFAAFDVGHRWGMGPFVQLMEGKFTGGSVHDAAGVTTSLGAGGWHTWAMLGFRAGIRP
jgi:hypothetical protein